MNNVDWMALYQSMARQNGDLQVTVDKLRNEIIPQYEALLKKANAERDEAIRWRKEATARLNAALRQLKATGCGTCKHYSLWMTCNYGYCLDNNRALWAWAGPEEAAENE